MAEPPKLKEFTPQAGDPLASEHAAVTRWLQEAVQRLGAYYWTVDLKSVETGRFLQEAAPEQRRRFVLAALAQVHYWSAQVEKLRTDPKTGEKRFNLHLYPDSREVWALHQHTVEAIRALLRRSLPFEKADIIGLLTWCLGPGRSVAHPLTQVTKALQRYAAAHQIDPELSNVMRKFAAYLRAYGKEFRRLGTLVEQLCDDAPDGVVPQPKPLIAKAPPEPAPVGQPLVLGQLKRLFGIATPDPDLITVQIGPDEFDMPAASPLANEHEKLTEVLEEIVESAGYRSPKVNVSATFKTILTLDPVSRGRLLLAASERHIHALFSRNHDLEHMRLWQSHYAAAAVAEALAASPVQFDRDGVFDFLLYLSTRPAHDRNEDAVDPSLFSAIENAANAASFTEGERFVLHLWRCSRIVGPPLGVSSPDVERLTQWIGDGAHFYLVPGEYWSDAVNMDIALLPAAARLKWISLFKHLLTATSARPSGPWRKTATQQLEAIGATEIRKSLERWLPLVSQGRAIPKTPVWVGDTRGAGDSINDENATVLRGFLWLVPLLPRREDLVRLVGSVALSAYKRIPGVGPRAVKVGNAAVYALSEIVSPESIGQLAMLKVRVRFGTAQKEIEKAFDAAATALELPRDQIEEMSVPTCGLESVGRRDEAMGEYRAELVVTGSSPDLKWFDAGGKPLKSVPASVKKDHAETVKDLQQGLKDVDAMLAAQRDRIDALFLERKSWRAPVWRERYLDHPLVGTIARRLIWCIGTTPLITVDSKAFDVRGKPFEIADDAEVTLWHPAGKSIDEVVAWRNRIEELRIVQPFKQAHREVYLLTDAERRTSTYSNRFAAHILRQHQFNALCGARRWKNKLRLMVDDTYPPASRELAAWGLRAEFWIDGIGEDYGVDTNESRVFLRLASDQVRFYRIGAASNTAHACRPGYIPNAPGPGLDNLNDPITLDEVPSLVFSEIMRDVDFFVGVTSIGNDPNWQDSGRDERFHVYWQHYSFGELSAMAVTRRETLQRLVPKLKIADRCTFNDRYLIVRGDRRTYKIHLGSGNILMEPNDEYLCIVPDSRARSNHAQVYLPFEGDGTLSIILSKAFLLAEDSKIKDATIIRQIEKP